MALSFAAMPPDGLSGSAMSHAGEVGAAGSVFAAVSWPVAAYFLAHVLWCGVQLAAPPSPGDTGAAFGRGSTAVATTRMINSPSCWS